MPGDNGDRQVCDEVPSREAGHTLTQTVGATPAPYDRAETATRSGTTLARLNSEWTHRFGPAGRVELRAGIGQARLPVHSFRTEFTDGSESRTLEDTGDSHDTTVTASGKWVATIFDEHSLVSGLEVESNRRSDTTSRGRWRAICRTSRRGRARGPR